MLSGPDIRKQFDALVQAGIGRFLPEDLATGEIKYIWEDLPSAQRLTVWQDEFELVYEGDRQSAQLNEILRLEGLPKLSDIHSIVSTGEVKKILKFVVVTVKGRIHINLPYEVYSAFAPFLGKSLRYRQLSQGR